MRWPRQTYQFTGDTFRLLKYSRATSGQLKKLLEILGKAKTNNSSAEEIVQTINKELPELNSLSSLLPKTRTELYTLIGVLITAITLYYTHLTYSESTKPKNTENPNIQINNFYNKNQEKTVTGKRIAPANRQSASNKIEVNQPCVCGSGLKTKICPCRK